MSLQVPRSSSLRAKLQMPPPPLPASRSRSLSRDSSVRSSTSSSSIAQSTPLREGEVPTVSRIEKDYDPISGRKVINNYEIIKEIGRGVHGKVKLGRNLENGEPVAIKIVDRTTRRRLGRPETSAQENKVRREIAILKKCTHPNVVRLREVIDDPMSRKIYLVLEYLANGELIWQTPDQQPALTQEQARSTFRDVVLGLEYLHYQGIIHRDIKPANLLWTEDYRTKISDFGVSHLTKIEDTTDNTNELELAKTAGTPAFFAPELCYVDASESRPPITGAIDVWALGVTLFCLLFGKCPFTADHEFELFHVIAKDELVIPDKPAIDDEAHDLLKRLLIKDPSSRITLSEVKRHPWVLRGIEDPVQWVEDNDPKLQGGRVEVTAEEVDRAVSLVDKLKRQLHKLSMSFSSLAGGLRRRSTTHGTPAKSPASEEKTMAPPILRRITSTNSDERSPRLLQPFPGFEPPPDPPPSTPTPNDRNLSEPFSCAISSKRPSIPRTSKAFVDLSSRSAATDVENYETSEDDEESDEEDEDEGFFLDFGKRARSGSVDSRLTKRLSMVAKTQLSPMEEKDNEIDKLIIVNEVEDA